MRTKTVLNVQNALLWSVTALWTIVMLLLLLLPGERITISCANNQDKYAHFLLFMLFSALLVLCGRSAKKVFSIANSSFAMVLGSGFGIATEILQHVVPGRTSSCFDGLANIAGVVFGIIATNFIIYYSRRYSLQARPGLR